MCSGGAGLNPGVASSVAPRGTPAGPTEPAAELMPNGEVTPIPGSRAADPADLGEDRIAAEECCQSSGDQFTSHGSLHY